MPRSSRSCRPSRGPTWVQSHLCQRWMTQWELRPNKEGGTGFSDQPTDSVRPQGQTGGEYVGGPQEQDLGCQPAPLRQPARGQDRSHQRCGESFVAATAVFKVKCDVLAHSVSGLGLVHQGRPLKVSEAAASLRHSAACSSRRIRRATTIPVACRRL